MTWPSAILFDLDGTLVDSAPDIADALNILLGEQGIEPHSLEAVTKMIGGGVPLLIERALNARGESAEQSRIEELRIRFVEIYAPRAAKKTKLFPGVLDVLETYHGEGVQLGVCTNKPEAITHMMLEALGMKHLFSTVIGGDTLPVKKPDPAPLLEALKHLECDASQAVMVGDSFTDADAAGAAAIQVILVTFGYTQTPVQELHHDGLVESFTQIPAVIKSLRNR